MANYNQRHEPKFARALLAERNQQVKAEINSLTKSDASKNTQDIASKMVAKHKLPLLEIGEPNSSISESTPTVVNVTWEVKGNNDFIGVKDSRGVWIENANGGSGPFRGFSARAKNKVDANIPFTPARANEQERIKNQIDSITVRYTDHFKLINKEIEAYNLGLETGILPLVEQKLKELSSIKSMEDFLNSGNKKE